MSKVAIADDSAPVELEGGQVIINKQASKKHWRELSKINQSAGGGLPLHEPQFKKGGIVSNDCIDFIRNSKAIINNGYYLNLSELSSIRDAYGQVPTNLKQTLITYNSGGQKNLKVTNTINAIELRKKLQSLLGIDSSQAYIVLNYYIDNARRFDTLDILDEIKHTQIAIIDRDKIVCSNMKYKKGGEIQEMTRVEIENKIDGLKLRLAKEKKRISTYETTERGKYNKLWKEKIIPMQNELDNLSDLYGKSKYSNGGEVLKWRIDENGFKPSYIIDKEKEPDYFEKYGEDKKSAWGVIYGYNIIDDKLGKYSVTWFLTDKQQLINRFPELIEYTNNITGEETIGDLLAVSDTQVIFVNKLKDAKTIANDIFSKKLYALNEEDIIKKYSKVKLERLERYAKGGAITTADLNRMIEQYNSEGRSFELRGAYGNYELWSKGNRLEVGSRKDIYNALVKYRFNEKYEQGGSIGFIPMDLEEKLALLSKWGGTNIRGVLGLLNAMIDTGVVDEDLVIKPTKNTLFQREKAIEKKIQEIWEKIQPRYNQELKGNMYYSTIKELIGRNFIYKDILKRFKPFRKYQKFEQGGSTDCECYHYEIGGL